MRFAPTHFPAAVVRTRTLGELMMTETRYGSEAALPVHSHDYACLVFVLGGTFRERCGTQRRDGAPGMVIVRPEGEPHSNRFDRAGGSCLNLELPPRWLTRVREHTRAFDTSAAFHGAPFALAGRRLREELAHPDDVSPLAVESLVLGTFADALRELGRSGAAPPPWLARTKEHIHAEDAA